MTNIEAALQALECGIVVKRYDGGYNEFRGNELYLLFDSGMYKLCVSYRQGFLAIDDFGKTWNLKPKGNVAPSSLFEEPREVAEDD